MTFHDQLKAAFPACKSDEDPRTDNHERVRSKLAKYRRARRRRRIAFSATATGLLVVAGVLLGPTAWAFYRLSLINGSVGSVKTAILDYFEVGEDGELTQKGRTLYANGQWRIERGATWQVHRDGKLWIYDPDRNRVVMRRKLGGPFSYRSSGFTVGAMLADHARWNWRQSIDFATEVSQGRALDKVTITDRSGRERSIVLADTRTHLPTEYRQEAHGAYGWQLRSMIKPSFDAQVDPGAFAVNVPPGAKVVDFEADLQAWKARLEKPLMVLEFGSARISVRDISVTPRGHVFLLYTDGETARDRQASTQDVIRATEHGGGPVRLPSRRIAASFEVTDSLGTEYVESLSSLQPYVGARDPSRAHGVVISDGEVLQGKWLMPVQTGSWAPRSLFFKVSAYFSGQSHEKSFRRRFDRPNSGVVPDWMPQIVIGPQTERAILSAERHALRPMMRKRGDWPGLEASLREDLEGIVAEERSKGESFAKGTVYYELYEALTHTNKRQEALEFLRLAANEPLYPNQYPAQEIESALRKEGVK